MKSQSASPPAKRAKLEPPSPSAVLSDARNLREEQSPAVDDEADAEFQCSICLQAIVDRTVIPTCSHEFCFECLLVWSEQSRRCPLCSQSIGEYLIHNIRSKYDFRRHHLTPLRTSPPPAQRRAGPVEAVRRRRTARERERERRLREQRETTDKLQRSIEKRRWIYRHDLYAKHVASNSYTRYRPYPTPAQFAASPELISRTTTFLRRELQVWDDLDVEFLTTFTISMMKSIDIRSESAIKLLAEFLDMGAPYVEGGRHVNAEHFAHEVYSYVRSPFRDLFVYDTVVQYDAVAEMPPSEQRRGRKWLMRSQSRSRSGARSRSRSRSHYRSRSRSRYARSVSRDRSLSWSPSGRRYQSTRSRPASPGHLRVHSRERRRHRELSNDVPREHQPLASKDPNRHPIPEDTVHGTSRRPTGTVKGKERADAEVGSAINEHIIESGCSGSPSAFGAELVAQTNSQLNLEPPEPRLPALERKKPPRNRSLLESVHAHLGTKTPLSGNSIQSEKGEFLNAERHHVVPSLHRSDSSTTPSLLARMSDPAETARRAESGPRLDTQASLPSTAHCHIQSAADNRPNSRDTKISEPETMARTRARMVKNLATSDPLFVPQPETVGSPAQQAGFLDIALPQAPAPARSLRVDNDSVEDLPAQKLRDLKNTSSSPSTSISTRSRATNRSLLEIHQTPISGVPGDLCDQEEPSNIYHMAMRGNPIDDERPPISTSHINDTSHPSASADVRTKLLARLAQEKCHARCVDTRQTASEPGHDRTLRAADTDGRSLVTRGPGVETSVVDPQLIETKLRTRAQLQVRLAAEKRSCGV